MMKSDREKFIRVVVVVVVGFGGAYFSRAVPSTGLIRALFSAPFPPLLLDDVNDVNGSTQSRRFFFRGVQLSLSLLGTNTNEKVARLLLFLFLLFRQRKKEEEKVQRPQPQSKVKKFPKKNGRRKKKSKQEKKTSHHRIASRIIIVQDGREGRRRPPRLSRRTFVHTMTTKRTYSNPIVRIGNWREDEALELVRRSFFCGSCTSVRGFFFENVFPVQHFPVQVFARLTRCARRAKRDRSLATLSARGLCVPAMFCNDRRNLKRTSRLKEMALDT